MLHRLESKSLEICVNSKGAELCSLKDKSGHEFLWQADPIIWPRHSPILFPVVGKLKNNRFVFEEKWYELSQHGFARDLAFELSNETTSKLEFELNASAATKTNYPFPFKLKLAYHLHNNQLICKYKVINPAKNPLYFSLGAHPGFNLPIDNNSEDEHYLDFEKNLLFLSKLNNGLITDTKGPLKLKEKRLPLTTELFREDALVFENNQINQISLCAQNTKRKITINCENWPYFGIWSKVKETEVGLPKFVCLEPWYGIADGEDHSQDLRHKKGIIELAPGTEFAAAYSISII